MSYVSVDVLSGSGFGVGFMLPGWVLEFLAGLATGDWSLLGLVSFVKTKRRHTVLHFSFPPVLSFYSCQIIGVYIESGMDCIVWLDHARF